MARRKMKNRVMDTLKHGSADALFLYPSMKLTWAFDSMARNYLPPAIPQEARTPVVGMGLALLPQLFADNYWTDKFSDMLLASSLVQTVQQAGNAGSGMPGPLDQTVNSWLQPIANAGMAGYTSKLRGYAMGKGRLRGYAPNTGAPNGMGAYAVKAAPAPPNMRGSGVRGSGIRGYQSEYRN